MKVKRMTREQIVKGLDRRPLFPEELEELRRFSEKEELGYDPLLHNRLLAFQLIEKEGVKHGKEIPSPEGMRPGTKMQITVAGLALYKAPDGRIRVPHFEHGPSLMGKALVDPRHPERTYLFFVGCFWGSGGFVEESFVDYRKAVARYREMAGLPEDYVPRAYGENVTSDYGGRHWYEVGIVGKCFRCGKVQRVFMQSDDGFDKTYPVCRACYDDYECGRWEFLPDGSGTVNRKEC